MVLVGSNTKASIQSADPMPAFAAKLNDDQVAAVSTYIRNAAINAATLRAAPISATNRPPSRNAARTPASTGPDELRHPRFALAP